MKKLDTIYEQGKQKSPKNMEYTQSYVYSKLPQKSVWNWRDFLFKNDDATWAQVPIWSEDTLINVI